MSDFNVGVGYRFNPTEAELACHYLYNKVMNLPLSCPGVVRHYDLYGHEEPWQIWEKFRRSNNDTTTDDDENDDDGDDEEEAVPPPQDDLFFFTTLKKVNPNGKSSKFERGVGSNGGRWHGDNLHTFHSDGITWNRRRYCYKNPNIGTTDASWIMMEYSLDDSLMQNAPHYTVLCRIRRKRKNNNCSRKRKSGQSNPQPKPKRQLKNMKLKTRTPSVEETVHVTAPPPQVPDHVAFSEDMINAIKDSCFTEEQINAISYASQYLLRSGDIGGGDGSLADSEQHQYHVGEDDDDNPMHSSLSGFLDVGCVASTSFPHETNLDGVNFDFEDYRPIVRHPQAVVSAVSLPKQIVASTLIKGET